MRYYNYNTFDATGKASLKSISDREILNSYWDSWKKRMLQIGYHEFDCDEESCIKDWVAINWAWENADSKG